MISQKRYIYACLGALVILSAALCSAQDYDDDGYGNQGNNQGGDGDNYGGSGYDDGYNQNNNPNYQVNVDTEGSNQQPSNYSPQGGSDADGDYEGEDGSAAASNVAPVSVVRVRRSVGTESEEEKSITSTSSLAGKKEPLIASAATEPKLRVKRHGKYYIGPVYTYVKTDKHANFKWGVKHKVGKKHHG